MPYSAPAKLGELDNHLLELWNHDLSALFERQVEAAKAEEAPSSGRAWLYNPIAASGGPAPSEATITWTAFPKRIADEAPTIVKAWQRADDSRNNQEEYCEWEVVRDPAQQNKIVRVTFTCETTDYYTFLAEQASDLLLALYQKHVSPSVQLSDLIADGRYIPQNKWNYPQTVGAHGVLMHMAQINNSFEAAVNLTAVASWPRADGDGRPITGEQALIACRSFGDSRRHSDPHIGAEINTLVRAGNEISFADPVGLYMDSIDQTDWETPDGTDAANWYRIVRGSRDYMLRVVFEAPPSAAHVLGDVKIGGRKIQFGGQIAEKIQIRIRGVARSAPTPAPKLTCTGAPSRVGLLAAEMAPLRRMATRTRQNVTLFSPE